MSEKKTAKPEQPSDKKKASVKKTAVIKNKKSSSKNKNKLITLINNLDEESLEILIEQAEILLHNIDRRDQFAKRKKRIMQGNLDLKKTYIDKTDKKTITIEEADDLRHFIIVLNGARNFFSKEEMKKIVKICHVSDDKKDAAGRLLNWLDKNRQDVIKNTCIEGKNDEALFSIYKYIVTHYTTAE